MQVQYGGVVIGGVNQNRLVYSVELVWNAGGQQQANRKHLHVEGFLLASGQNAISAADTALAVALGKPYQDLLFLADDGSQTDACLPNKGSITGVRIENLKFPKTEGPEFATERTFSFDAWAEYPIAGTLRLLLNYHETLTFSGGGPLYAHRLSLNGLPQKQLIYPSMPYRVIQAGEAVGYLAYPSPAFPIWPVALMKNPEIIPRSPKRMGQGYEEYPVSWHYEFESAYPLTGVPHLWIN